MSELRISSAAITDPAAGSPRTPLATVAARRMFVGLMLLATTLGACSDWPARIRRHTYPPNFQYIGAGQLQSTMWQLAHAVNELDRVMREPGPIDATRRAEAVRLLSAMAAQTDELQANGRPSNHPLISTHLEQFRRDLLLARAAVQAEPPNYYLVGSVSGACLTCHSPSS